jgi:hypothetical protein
VGEYENAIERLANHANLLIRNGEAKDDESLLYHLWLASRQRSQPRLDLMSDVVQCLFVLNSHFNGPDPDHAVDSRSEHVPDRVTYAVANIISACLGVYRQWLSKRSFSDDVLAALLTGTHQIVYAWEQFLAGDITDLLDGFELA